MARFAGGNRPTLGAFVLHCRGDVRLYCGTTDCTPKSKKGRALLAVLAAEQRPLSRLKIIDLLWSDRQEEQARASLRTLLADLKEQFREQFEELLVVDRERVALGDSVRVDLTDPTIARPAGELFEGLDHIDPELDEWLRVERERWTNLPKGSPIDEAEPYVPPRSHGARFGVIIAVVLAIATGTLGRQLTSDWNLSKSDPVQDQLRSAGNLLLRNSPATAEKARTLLVKVVEKNPDDALALAMLAEATMASSDHPGIGGSLPLSTARREARAYSSRAIRLDPRAAPGWAALGFSYFGTAQAVRPLERAVALDKNTAKYRWQLARALEYENRYDEAYLHARRAIELDPRGAEPVIGFIRAAIQLDRVKEMKAEVAAYSSRSPAATDRAFVEGFAAYQINDYATCIRYLEPLVRNGDYRPLSALISCLTSLGEKRRAAELSSKMPSLRSDILREDANAVERRAAAMGREFWLRNFESLAAADLLLKAGKTRALIQSFDASYDGVAEFEREGGRVAIEPTALLLAMQRAGRLDDARQLRNLLVKQVKDQRAGMGFDTWSLSTKAAVALIDGQREQAVTFLEQCFPDCMVGHFDMDISQGPFFGRLNGHPRFDRLIRRYRELINLRRKDAGLPPLRIA